MVRIRVFEYRNEPISDSIIFISGATKFDPFMYISKIVNAMRIDNAD